MKKVKLTDVYDDVATATPVISKSYGNFSIGDVIAAAFKLLFGNFVNYTLVCAAIFLPLVIWAATAENGFAYLQFDLEQVGWSGFAITMFITTLLGFVAYSSIVYGALEQQADHRAGFLKMISGGINHLIPVILASILVTLLTMFGYILLIIPGIIIALALEVVVPVILAEKRGPMNALRRSAELTDGFKGSIFGVTIFIGGFELALQYSLELLHAAIVTPDSSEAGLAIAAATLFQFAVTTAIGGTASAAIYSQLRFAKEGASTDEIAQVFS